MLIPLTIVLAKKAAHRWVLEGDIRACFDELSHDWLLGTHPIEQSHIAQVAEGGIPGRACPPSDGSRYSARRHLPPVIANLALNGLEARLRTAFPRYVWNGRKQVCPRVHFIRLADDFVITGATKALLEDDVKPLVEVFLQEEPQTA